MMVAILKMEAPICVEIARLSITKLARLYENGQSFSGREILKSGIAELKNIKFIMVLKSSSLVMKIR